MVDKTRYCVVHEEPMIASTWLATPEALYYCVRCMQEQCEKKLQIWRKEKGAQ